MAFLMMMGLPQCIISVPILLFRAPITIIVNDCVLLDQEIYPTSGIR